MKNNHGNISGSVIMLLIGLVILAGSVFVFFKFAVDNTLSMVLVMLMIIGIILVFISIKRLISLAVKK